MSEPVDLCGLDELVDGAARRFDVADRRLAVVRLGDDVFVIGDRCSHANVSLAGGFVDADTATLECPKHGSEFGLSDGNPTSLPATKPVPTYCASVVEGRVIVNLEHGHG